MGEDHSHTKVASIFDGDHCSLPAMVRGALVPVKTYNHLIVVKGSAHVVEAPELDPGFGMLREEHIQTPKLLLLLRWKLANRLLKCNTCLEVGSVAVVRPTVALRDHLWLRLVQANVALVLQSPHHGKVLCVCMRMCFLRQKQQHYICAQKHFMITTNAIRTYLLVVLLSSDPRDRTPAAQSVNRKRRQGRTSLADRTDLQPSACNASRLV